MTSTPCPYCGHSATAHYTYGCVLVDDTGHTCPCSAPPSRAGAHYCHLFTFDVQATDLDVVVVPTCIDCGRSRPAHTRELACR